MARYSIVGASGTVGSALLHSLSGLIAAGDTIQAITSDRAKAGRNVDGVSWVHLDLATGEGLTAALAATDRLFLLAPPGHPDQDRLLLPLISEAKRRGLQKVVLMTASGVESSDGPMRRVELALESSGLPFNIVRPNWFMQNFHTFWRHPIVTQSALPLPAGDAPVSFIDGRDIGEVAARLLVDDHHSGRAFELTGPQALTHAEAAQVLSEAVGRKITYTDIEPPVFHADLVAAGLPSDYADLLVQLMAFVRAGYNARVTQDVEAVLGKPARSLAAYARDFRGALASASAA
jgi:uncharacterized protein YbjT (DUF2867 family)